MRQAGARQFYVKRLAPNDNSKNQVYLGGGFGALNLIPHGSIEVDTMNSRSGKAEQIAKANVDFYWITTEGTQRAPNCQLILYPQYPEVRMSGFLRGASNAPNALMTSRDHGRLLILGVCPDGRVIGYAVSAGSAIETEITRADLPQDGVFLVLTKFLSPHSVDPLTLLLQELGRINRLGPIPGKRLYPPPPGTERPYRAPNAVGYTLEAELGVLPNGISEPDFLGWEIKSFSVTAAGSMKAKSATTLLTPEPTIGIYADDFLEFMRRFGYDDTKGRAGRRNFGGIYRLGEQPNKRTTLSVHLDGFDPENGKILDFDAMLSLVDPNGVLAAGWRLKDIVAHWSRKHARAAYVPAFQPKNTKSYSYGDRVEIGEGTDAIMFLKAILSKAVYLDPGIKIENGVSKKRNQFRIKHTDLPKVYSKWSTVDVI